MGKVKFVFRDENKNLVETNAKNELAARRKIRRVDRKLKELHLRRGRLELLNKDIFSLNKEKQK